MKQVNVKKIDKFIPWMFVLFFIVIACVDGIFVTTAIKTQTGLGTDKAYETGSKYNDILKSADEQKKLGCSHEVTVTDNGVITFTIKDKNGTPITGADISLLCFRTVQDGMDIASKLIETKTGVYTARPEYKAAGLWQIFLTVNANGSIYKVHQEITIQK